MMLTEEAKETGRLDQKGPATFSWGKCHPELFRQQCRERIGSRSVKLKAETSIW